MTWTVVADGDSVNVRAVLNVKTEQQEIAALIAALQKRQREESGNDQRETT